MITNIKVARSIEAMKTYEKSYSANMSKIPAKSTAMSPP